MAKMVWFKPTGEIKMSSTSTQHLRFNTKTYKKQECPVVAAARKNSMVQFA